MGINPSGDQSRRIALALLSAIVDQGSPLDEVFERALSPRGALAVLQPRDRSFVRNLVTTTIRRLGQIDAVLAHFAERAIRPAGVRNVLRLGAAQLLFLRTPAHAATTTAVALVEAPPLRGFVNAVLRRIATEGDPLVATQDAARLTTPAWLWEGWTAAYGEAGASAIAAAHLVEPPLDLTLKDPASTAVWAERLSARILPTGSLRLAHAGTITALPGYKAGAWWVQDAAAALPVRLLGEIKSRAVIDLCAAPGGKTAQLAAAGGRVVALDIARGRLGRLRDNLDRTGLRAVVIEADATTWSPTTAGFGPADAVLLDAPCSATGTLRRHPDIALHKSAADVARMADLQDRLLANAATMVKPGGLLVFCSCSLEPAEGPLRIAAFLEREAGFLRRPITDAEFAGVAPFVTPEGDLRTLPSQWAEHGGIDGFFIARLVRAA